MCEHCQRDAQDSREALAEAALVPGKISISVEDACILTSAVLVAHAVLAEEDPGENYRRAGAEAAKVLIAAGPQKIQALCERVLKDGAMLTLAAAGDNTNLN